MKRGLPLRFFRLGVTVSAGRHGTVAVHSSGWGASSPMLGRHIRLGPWMSARLQRLWMTLLCLMLVWAHRGVAYIALSVVAHAPIRPEPLHGKVMALCVPTSMLTLKRLSWGPSAC